MVILKGGETHLLTHRNWKFEKFMTQKIQTNDLQRIEATSADNVKMHTQATVVWRVSDVENAARMSAETMRSDGGEVKSLASRASNIDKLQNDVLKQATASLAAFIGEVRYSDTFHVSAAGTSADSVIATDVGGGGGGAPAPPEYSPIWDSQRMSGSLAAANKVTGAYGVTILSINIISAVPADDTLQNALAAGAVASAEAEQAETIARGKARAVRIMAEGDAMAQTIRAEGAYTAGEKLGSSEVAVELARLDKIGTILGERTSFFFGADPSQLGSIMSNPKLVR
jgi:regulator of protease activity HflC (stomatin/prohibitin superfamily)